MGFDALIVGGGHNGLTCAAYLARGGLDVCVLERRATVGGCASTVDALDGARVNICNCDHAIVRATGIVEELDLAAHGLAYVELEPSLLALDWAGSAPWFAFSDPGRTRASLELTHPSQVAGYDRYRRDLEPVARLVLDLMRTAPTPAEVLRRLPRHPPRAVAGLLKLSRRSTAAALQEYFTDEALLGPASLTGPAVWGLAPQTPGTGLGALGYAIRHLAPTGRPVGGSGALTDALASALRAAGGTVRTDAHVAQIRTRGGAACGVTLADGTQLDAPLVIAAADPRTVCVDLLRDAPGAEALAARWRGRPAHDGYESKVDAVIDRLPRLRGLDPDHLAALGVTEPLGPTVVVTPTLAGIAAARAAADAGRVAEQPLLMTNVPSVPDPSVRLADGTHVFSLEVLFTPYRLAGGWAGSREPERWLEQYATLVEPGFLESVKRFRLVGPEEYERDFAMPAGYAPSFAGGPLAALAGRDRELTRYATSVEGLYLTGAGTFPGAGVSGAPGRNAARVVLAARHRRGSRRAAA